MTRTLTATAALLACAVSPMLGQERCQAREATAALERAFADSVTAFQRQAHQPVASDAGVVAAVPVTSSQGCLTAYALSEGYPRPFVGAVFLVDSNGAIVGSFPEYASPTGLVAAGRNRVAFEYVEGEGAGALFTHLLVLCSFGTDSWEECLSMPLQNHLRLSEGLSVMRDAHFEVRDPYVFVMTSGTWYYVSATGERREGTLPEDTVRLRLP